jgi:hypothetical protein
VEQGVLKIVDAILALTACLRQSPSLPRALHDECHMSEVRREPNEFTRSRHSIFRLILETPIFVSITLAVERRQYGRKLSAHIGASWRLSRVNAPDRC